MLRLSTDTDTDDNTLAENVANGASAEITALLATPMEPITP